MKTNTPSVAAGILLDLYAASERIQRAHREAVRNGDTTLAATLEKLGRDIAYAVGLLVKGEAEKRRAEVS